MTEPTDMTDRDDLHTALDDTDRRILTELGFDPDHIEITPGGETPLWGDDEYDWEPR